MADHFNPIDYAHRLEAAGVPAAQAEVHASVLAEVVETVMSAATGASAMKSELLFKVSTSEVTLRAEIKDVETTLRADLKGVETRLCAELKGVETRLRAEIHDVETRLRAEIQDVETRLRAEIQDVAAKLGSRIDRLEAKMDERFRWQWWANGVMVALLIGLYLR